MNQSSNPHEWARPGLRRTLLFALGLIVTAAAVLAIRNPTLVPGSLHSQIGAGATALRLCFPRTILFGGLLALLGAAAQAIAGSGIVARKDIESRPIPTVGRWGATAWLIGVTGACATLAWLEWNGWLKLPIATVLWLAAIASGLLCGLAMDRRNRVRMAWDLTPVEWAFLFFAVVGGGVYWLHDVDSWRYAAIGDEYSFLHAARERAAWPWSRWDSLEAKGVHRVNPMMTTVLQALSVSAFGPSARAWTGATVALMLLPLPALYKYARALGGIGAGVIACVAFIGSPVLIAHSKMGYPNGMMLMPIILTVCFADLATRRGSILYAFLAGASAGFGIFLVGIGFLISTAYLAVTLGWELATGKDRRTAAIRVGVVFLAWLVTAFPILIQWDFFAEIVRHESGRNKDVGSYVLRNTIGSIGAFLQYCGGRTHFLAGHASDAVSTFLILVGVVWTVLSRNWKVLVLLALTILLGLSGSGNRFLPFTRVLILVIPWALLAGFGGAWILRWVRPGIMRTATGVALIAAIAATSWSNAYDDADREVSKVHYIAWFLQEIAPGKRAILVTPMNLMLINRGAFDRTEVDAVAVYPEHSLDVLVERHEAGPHEEFLAFIDPAADLPAATAAYLTDHRIPAFAAVRTVGSRLEARPEPLTPLEIRAFVHAENNPLPGDGASAPALPSLP